VTTTVRLMNEYSVAWPLWVAGGPAGDGDLPVSAHLTERLRAWARHFDEHFHWEHGWDDDAHPVEHAREALRLRRALQDDLGPGFRVVLDLWEAPAPSVRRG
jgi:hypothetical protein